MAMIRALALLVTLASARAGLPRSGRSTRTGQESPPPLRKFEYSDADPDLTRRLNCSVYVVHDVFVRTQNDSLFLPGSRYEHRNDSYFLGENGTAITCDEQPGEERDEFTAEFLACGHFFLERDEFEVRDNRRVHVDVYDRTYAPGEYYLADGGVYVCMPRLDDAPGGGNSSSAGSNRTELDYFDKFPDSFGYLTYAGLLVSVACLLLHLLVFCTVPSVRNLPGCCLASLSLSLLMAYACFMAIGAVDEGDGAACVGLGLCVYYFFLCAFFWMNAIAFDVWRSFRVVVRELRISVHRVPWRRFLLYSAYSWLVPASLTVLVRVSDESDIIPERFRPDFGRAYCWFGRRTALLAFFAAPLVCVMLLNAAFFLDVAFLISRASLKTSRSHEQTLRKRFFVFLRLALIMGLTWIVGLVAGYADNVVMWCLFIALNTLQGMFIFAVFSCSSKVRQLCCRGRSVQRGSTSVRTISQASAAV